MMVHSEHNRSRNSGGFALVILGALLLFLAPNIYSSYPGLGVASLVGGGHNRRNRILSQVSSQGKTSIKRTIHKKYMGLFGKKKETDEPSVPTELEAEVARLRDESETKREEVARLEERLGTVREEYDDMVGNLMSVKGELNQKKMELDVAQSEHRSILSKIKAENDKPEPIPGNDRISVDDLTAEHEKAKAELVKTESDLNIVRKQLIETSEELEEANSRLYNAKTELDKRDQFEDTDVLTPKEREFIQGTAENKSDGVIEAASAVVGALKSKLNTAQIELDSVQMMLEKEREAHAATRRELESKS